jgi:hypothetical protein
MDGYSRSSLPGSKRTAATPGLPELMTRTYAGVDVAGRASRT